MKLVGHSPARGMMLAVDIQDGKVVIPCAERGSRFPKLLHARVRLLLFATTVFQVSALGRNEDFGEVVHHPRHRLASFDDVAVPDGRDTPRQIMELDIVSECCVEAANGEDAGTRTGP